jgi:hypothetical protein
MPKKKNGFKDYMETQKHDYDYKDSVTGRIVQNRLNKKNLSKYELDEIFADEYIL